MRDLENISVKQLFSLSMEDFEKYNNALRFLDSRSLYLGRDGIEFTSLSFKEVVFIRRSLEVITLDGMIEVFGIAFGLKPRFLRSVRAQFLSGKVLDFYKALNWLQDEITRIGDKEKLLSGKPNSKLIEAGIEKLSILGDLNTLISIGEQFGEKPQSVQEWNYSLVFSISLREKLRGEIQEAYSKLTTKTA